MAVSDTRVTGKSGRANNMVSNAKQHAKTFAMQAALRKAEAEGGAARDGERKPEDVKTLGLLPGGPEEKNLRPGIIPAKKPSMF